MFIGHFALGLAAKKATPQISLGTLLLSCQFLDLLWPILVIAGIEQVVVEPGNTVVTPLNFISYPFSHSLAMSMLFGLGFALIYKLFRKSTTLLEILIVGSLVVSHWVLDWISHRPDLQLAPGLVHRYGLGLWNSFWGTAIIECIMFIIGLRLYLNITRAKNKRGHILFWAFIVFLSVIYTGNLFGPPPPSAMAVVVVDLTQWLLIGWAYWIDANRTIQI